jgi:hypothetical protein
MPLFTSVCRCVLPDREGDACPALSVGLYVCMLIAADAYVRAWGGQERDLADEHGWRQVHGDVFRTPEGAVWLAALVGTGGQLALLVVLVLSLTIATELYTESVHTHTRVHVVVVWCLSTDSVAWLRWLRWLRGVCVCVGGGGG